MLSEYDIYKWKQSGKIFLWSYEENIKNYPGWHLTCDKLGCESLLTFFKEIENANMSFLRSICITEPTPQILKVPNNKGGKAKWKSYRTLKIDYRIDDFEFWNILENELIVTISFGKKKLSQLIKGIVNVINDKGDYSINSEFKFKKNQHDMDLWFWWMNC